MHTKDIPACDVKPGDCVEHDGDIRTVLESYRVTPRGIGYRWKIRFDDNVEIDCLTGTSVKWVFPEIRK